MITALLANIFVAQALAQEPVLHNLNEGIKNVKMLKAGVSAVDMLPEEIYGKWSVRSVLIDDGGRDEFKSETSDIWVFRRLGNDITLTNPVTQASASIHIDEVKNDVARFSRTSISIDEKEKETVVVEIKDGVFIGSDVFVIEKYKDGKLISQDVVKYKLRGQKISGQESIFKH